MKLLSGIIIAGLFIASLSHAGEPPTSEEQKTLYAIGASIANSLSIFTFSQAEQDLVLQGLQETLSGKTADFDTAAYNARIQSLAKERRKLLGDKQAELGKEFLEKASREKGAVKTASGIVYNELVAGKGDSPQATDIVTVNYRGTLTTGKEFDSSYKRGKPLEFRLDNVIKCWTEGVQKMKPGGKARLVCPANMAYGDTGVGDKILPGATLAFDIELLAVNKAASQPAPAKTSPAPRPATPATTAKPAATVAP
jgi:FKBP-type peptidyl-prolyl cis-trans isomerase FkpA